LGALSAMDIVWRHPQEFSRAGLFSGSFWWRTKDKADPQYNEHIHRIIQRQVAEGSYHPGLKFFFECGTEDETEDRNRNGIIDSIDDTRDLIKALVAKGYDPVRDIHYLEIPGGHHDVATWAKVLPQFFNWAYNKKNRL
jgi:enterochelin esterase-like enzyme